MAMNLTESLKSAIKNCGLSNYRIAKMTGIDANILGRFLKGQRGICLSTAAKIAEAIGVELR